MMNLLKNCNVYILCLLPFSLITGPFLSDLSICLSGLFFLIYLFKEKKWYFVLNKAFIFFIIWCLYLILLSLFSEAPYISFQSSLFYWRFGFFALSIWYFLENDDKFIIKFTNFFIIAYILVLLDGYFQFLVGHDILGNEYQGDRLSALFGNEKILGSYLSRLLPILFALVAITYSDSKKIIYLMMFILVSSDILIYLSGERTSFFYLFISSLIIIIFTKKWKIVRSLTLTISLIIILTISFTHQYTKNRMIDQTIEQTNILGNKINLFSIQHQVVYETSYKIFKDNYLFGIGPKMFREKCKDYKTLTAQDQSVDGCQTHPHNTYVQLFVETGIFGTIPIIIIFMTLIITFTKHIINIFSKDHSLLSDQQVCLLTAIFITLWPLVPAGSFFNNWLNVIYYLPVGFLLYEFNKRGINK